MTFIPQCKKGSKILVIGASGGIGRALLGLLAKSEAEIIGAHYSKNIPEYASSNCCLIQRELSTESDCNHVIEEFIKKAGGLDVVVNLAGGIHFSGSWMEMPEEFYLKDISLNLNIPFFIARSALQYMKAHNNWGRIILTGTESALHGGSETSFPYAIAKRGTECLVQGLAREGARHNVLVNGVRFGYIKSGFHQRWHNRTEEDMSKRATLVPLKRGGEPLEAAGLIVYLMSEWASFITGQMLPLTGGDWL